MVTKNNRDAFYHSSGRQKSEIRYQQGWCFFRGEFASWLGDISLQFLSPPSHGILPSVWCIVIVTKVLQCIIVEFTPSIFLRYPLLPLFLE
jgi:hypothetical protein